MRQKNEWGRFRSGRQARCRAGRLGVRVSCAGVALLAGLAIATVAGPGASSPGADGITPPVTVGVSVNPPQLGIDPANTGCCA